MSARVFQNVINQLKENVNKLHAVASTLLEKEKIDGKEFEEIDKLMR